MLFKNIALLDEDLNLKENMYVGILKDKIDYISLKKPTKDYGYTYDGNNKLLMSALVNAHTHIPMTLLRGYAEEMTLQDWLFKKVFPFEDMLTPEAVYYGSLLGIAEMLRTGTGSFSDMYFKNKSIIDAVMESKIKCNLCTAIVNSEDVGLHEAKNYKDMLYFYNEFHNAADGRLKIDMAIHAEFTSTERVVIEFAREFAKYDTIFHIHLSETEKENQECIGRHKRTPAKYFYDAGVFNKKTLAAHCTHLTQEDMEILRDNGVSVAHCPVSNLKLAGGVAQADSMLKMGINLALGTDGPASNNNLNLFEELKLFAILHKGVYSDPMLISPKTALKCASHNGYIAQGREQSGVIKEGSKADLTVINLDSPHLYPRYNILNNIVFSGLGSDVVLTMVDGNVLYSDGEYLTIDIEKAKYEANRLALNIAVSVS